MKFLYFQTSVGNTGFNIPWLAAEIDPGLTLGILTCIFVFGLVGGSFLNVVIVRLATGESPLGSRSRCSYCRQTIAWYDNIPLVSFVLLGRRCRRCRALIDWQYPLVELATCVVFDLLFWRFG